jgi:hypothetical protein
MERNRGSADRARLNDGDLAQPLVVVAALAASVRQAQQRQIAG